jgi:outer membrane protein assembly factor BamB
MTHGRRSIHRRSMAALVVGAAAAMTLVAACGSGAGRQTSSPGARAVVRAAPMTSGLTAIAASRVVSPAAPVAAPPTATAHPPATPADWPTYDRTGNRNGLSVTTPTFTSSSHVVKGWSAALDGDIYAQPLVVGHEVIVATENDSVYAFDSTTGHEDWMRHLASPVTGGLACAGDINPSGITGTPVAFVEENLLYVVTFTSSPTYEHVLWALDLSNGHTVSHRPVDGPATHAHPAAQPTAEQERGALALDEHRVYVPYGGLDGDCGPYHGWVVGAPTAGTGPLVSYVTPTQREAGIWAPPGPTVAYNSLYVATGNGTPTNAVDGSDSVIRLRTSDLSVRGSFTPSNFAYLSANDVDLGSTSPVALPDDMIFMIGKEGVGYVIGAYNLDRVGGQRAELNVCDGGFGGDAASGTTVVVSCFDSLTAVHITPATKTAKPVIKVIWSVGGIQPGPPIIAGGVVWDASRGGELAGYELSDGRQVYSTAIGDGPTSFPTLSASKDRLFVPEGETIVSYKGV